jgi:acyl-lipid omega-6 desaturase (Delta-12 desaturase)
MEAATTIGTTTRAGRRSEAPSWVPALAPYGRADLRLAVLDVATSAVPYVALSVVMYRLLDVSYLLVLAVAIPASGFLLRTYIVFHDCAHGSFLPSKRANRWFGVFVGLLVYSPFHAWRQEHAGHHATSGDLDRRGIGDVDTLTVAEYLASPWGKRLAYRLFRNPLIMFGLGPIWALALEPRLVPRRARRRIQRSHLLTDLALAVLVGALCWQIGWLDYLLLQAPTVLMAGAVGVWLFYVQHQFEDAYWQHSGDWDYADAALRGSSHLKLPKVLQFFTGNIGLHHVHHLSPRIPNYNLQRAHDDHAFLNQAPTLSLWDGLRAVRLKLYDEESGRLVTFAQARDTGAAPVPGSPSRAPGR